MEQLLSFANSNATTPFDINVSWKAAVDYYGEYNFFVYGTILITSLAYWGSSFFFFILDFTGFPSFLLRYKIQPDQNSPLLLPDLIRALKRVTFNAIILNTIMTMLYYHPFTSLSGPIDRPLPGFFEVLFHLAMFLLVEEAGFYYSHRLFHHKSIYSYFHKIHHEWKAPIAMTAIYAHPLEHILANLLPVALGPIVMGSHLATTWFWFALALTNTCYSHSGYHFPFTLPTQYHDYHHLKFTNNFGVLGILDYLHGTDGQYRASPQFKNDRPFFTLTPVWYLTNTAKDLFPTREGGKGSGKGKSGSKPKDN